MFAQVIEGRVADREGLQRRMQVWLDDLKPTAEGYLGSTGGIAEDGTLVLIARFESEEAARRNSERPEQGAWWTETAKYFEGEPTFSDSTEVQVLFADDDCDDAGFVQLMRGRCTDRARMRELEAGWDVNRDLRDGRPDLVGSVMIWHPGDEYTMVAYFRSEAEARENEAKPMPAEAQERFAEWGSLMGEMRYVDLKEPMLDSA